MMGGGIARSLARAGLPVHAYNRTRAKAAALETDGVVVHDNPVDAADGADVLITMLLDAPTIEQVVGGPGGPLERLAPAGVWLQTSTVGAAVDHLARLAERAGVAFYDSPVVGPPAAAARGELGVLVAGPVSGRERLGPLLDAIARRTLWVGTRTEASRLKLAVNGWVLAVTVAVAEAMALTRSLGLDPELFLTAIEGSPLGAEYARLKGKAILSGELAPSFSVRSALKDAALIAAAGRDTGAATLLADAVLEQYRRTTELGHADDDFAAVYHAALAALGST
jgi:3-hydroxyisobutyrate dehydrogenase